MGSDKYQPETTVQPERLVDVTRATGRLPHDSKVLPIASLGQLTFLDRQARFDRL
jgi:hypothetical protein